MEFVEFKDVKVVPDPVHSYSNYLRTSNLPIVIDNGSYNCRVGWANSDQPLLTFKNILAKPRKEKGKKDGEMMVGNDIANIEAVRFLLKSQFDHNVVTHYEVQENILNHAFSRLGIDTPTVDHPVALTEPFVNPNYCRMMMSELLFECYGVPGVSYTVDCLLSFQQFSQHDTGLVIGLGYQCCHVVPVIDGSVDSVRAKRLDLGGAHVTHYLQRLLQLKYPAHLPLLTLSRAEELIHRFGRVAKSYSEEISLWEDCDYYDNNTLYIRLPSSSSATNQAQSQTGATTPGATVSSTTQPATEPKEKRPREFTRRLLKARKREEKLAEDEEQLSQLMAIQDLQDEGDEDEFQKAIKEFKLSSGEDLGKMIAQIQARIEKTRQKIVVANTTAEETLSPTPTEKLPKEEEEYKAWISEMCKKREEILERRAQRKQKKLEMVKRRTPAAMERMRIISRLARNEEDDFGLRDEDWDVYKAINKDGDDSESEGENERLEELEGALKAAGWSDAKEDRMRGREARDQGALHFSTERLRAVEVYLQPSLLGSTQTGLVELAAHVLSTYPLDVAERLSSNVVLCGGPSALPGLEDRLLSGLIACRPFGSKVSISTAPPLSSFTGLSRAATSLPYMTRQDYMERGGDYLHTHSASNKYYPSPLPLAPSNNLPNFDDMEVEILLN